METLLLSVVYSQGLSVWTDQWKDIISKKSVLAGVAPPARKEFIITWMGMGQFIERVAAAWKKQAFEELHAINLRMKNISMMTESAASLLQNKNELLKQDAQIKDEAYKQALVLRIIITM